ncbi:MarR family winged helix-turn-helix transcriptional regulator [Sphingomonas sp. Leaf208]|uniref:MarR family winged helix-turn-helix transcriptional regulator n=1 Tax=Sphingomonas sp. Leaf208 TaxID=1735679 RepID=UPI00138EE06B|nr:MarR family transcriptional regulator [Sphingomonas sp. Leaf208]
MDDYLGFRLRRIQNRLSKDFAAAVAEHGLKQGLFSSLALISANPGTSQAFVSREVGLDKSATVAIVDELERRGWAERQASATDRRRHALFITPAGDAFLDQMFVILDRTEQKAVEQLSAAEFALLQELLDRIYVACVE